MQAPNPAPSDARLTLTRELRRRLVERIHDDGPIPFAAFMEAALYEHELGYYTADLDPWDASPDFVTVPQVHPALGTAIAALVAETDAALGAPERFEVVEMGSGDGSLVGVVARELASRGRDLADRVRVWSAERGRGARARQRRRLPDRVRVVRSLAQVPADGAGLFYSNELLDALPAHRLAFREGRLLESHVDVEAGSLVERWLPPASEGLERQLSDGGIVLRPGQIAEVCLGVRPWLGEVSRRLARGALLTIDYGHESATLYNENRPAGTLVCQSRFRLGDDFLSRPGAQDMTAHVDFGNLRRCAHAEGFAGGELCSLRVFLLGMGVTAGSSGAPESRLALRHLLVDPVADAHRAMLLTRGLEAGQPRFGRRRLEHPATSRGSC